MSLECKFISKLTMILHLKADILLIITLKQPSASVNPVTQLGFKPGSLIKLCFKPILELLIVIVLLLLKFDLCDLCKPLPLI